MNVRPRGTEGMSVGALRRLPVRVAAFLASGPLFDVLTGGSTDAAGDDEKAQLRALVEGVEVTEIGRRGDVASESVAERRAAELEKGRFAGCSRVEREWS